MAKKGSIAEKDSAAIYFFNKKSYETAMPLLEELLGVYRGTARYQKILYFYAFSKYGMHDYLTAAFYFEEFTKQFPNSEYTEEAQFMIANCYRAMSADYVLDQSETQKAIEQFELFIEQYPMSARVEKSEVYIKELREKLMTKAWEQANLYYKIGYYKSAVLAFKNFVSDYPASPYREEAAYKMVKSSLEYAKMSIESKQIERYENTLELYQKFLDRYPQSKYIKDLEDCYSFAQKNLEKLKKNIQ
jgi:outer membrane protein assembly factor BamD